jgi:uncharacterized protein YlzI (FlbEa/FlbD family)
MAVGVPMKWLAIAFAFVMFHRLDGHAVWVNTNQVNTVQGAGQLGFPTGTAIAAGSEHMTVKENVDEVIRALRQEPK